MTNKKMFSKLFSLKGISLFFLLLATLFTLGFIGGLIIEKIKNLNGKTFSSLQLSFPIMLAIITTALGSIYFLLMTIISLRQRTE
jgi:hypothetical protein